MKKITLAIALLLLLSPVLRAQEKKQVLIKNVNVFDGVNEKLQEGVEVLIEDNLIKEIGSGIESEDALVIDAEGKTMTPGFIFMHEHLMMQSSSPALIMTDSRYKAYTATRVVKEYLDHGITTVRDAAGNTYSLRTAIDEGLIPGPRIYPSGPMISQTSGHADHRFGDADSKLNNGVDDVLVRQGDFAVVDGVPEVLKASREALRMGSSQIKIAVGGGTGSISDPLEVVEFTSEEIRAATQAASDFGTYVMAHVYNNEGIRRAIDNGVKCIEHGNLMNEETMRYMMEKDIWLSPQIAVYTFIPAGYSEDQARKHRQAYAGIDNMFTIAKKIGFNKIVMGSDIISNFEAIQTINDEFELRTKWFTPYQILKQATSNGAELLSMSGPKNPYKGKLGVIQEGAYADLLLIDGNPLEDISILKDHESNIVFIMTDGKIFKNNLN